MACLGKCHPWGSFEVGCSSKDQDFGELWGASPFSCQPGFGAVAGNRAHHLLVLSKPEGGSLRSSWHSFGLSAHVPGDLSRLHWLQRYMLGLGGVAAVCIPRRGLSGFLVMAGGVTDWEVSLRARPGPQVPFLQPALGWSCPGPRSKHKLHRVAGLGAVMTEGAVER